MNIDHILFYVSARILASDFRIDNAINLYRKVPFYLKDEIVLFQLGWCFSIKNIIDSSEFYYTKCLDFNPNNDMAWNNLGSIYHSRNELELAENCFKKAFLLNKNNDLSLINLAHVYLKEKKYDTCLLMLTMEFERDSSRKYLYNALANYYTYFARFDSAEYFFRCKLKLFKDDIQSYIDLGYFYLNNLRDTLRSDQIFYATLSSPCSKDSVLIALSLYNLKKKDFKSTMKYSSMGIAQYPDEKIFNYFLGFSYLKTKDFDNAKKCFDSYILFDSTQSSVWRFYGVYYYKKNNFQESIKSFQNAIKFSPKDALFWHELAIVYKRIGDKMKSDKCFAEASRLDPFSNRLYMYLTSDDIFY